MNQEERESKIDAILGGLRDRTEFPDVPIHLWITGAERGKPGEPDFEEWMKICTQMVDAYRRDTGRRDTDSSFAIFVRTYGRREYEK